MTRLRTRCGTGALDQAARRRRHVPDPNRDGHAVAPGAAVELPPPRPRSSATPALRAVLAAHRRMTAETLRRTLLVLLLAGGAAAGSSLARAQSAGGQTTGSPASGGQGAVSQAPGGQTAVAAAAATTPPSVQFGGDVRVRGEALDNATDLNDLTDDAYQYTRMRYRLWADAKPREGLRVFIRLGNEYRWGVYGAGPDYNKPASIRDPESRVSLDNAWAEVAWPPASGLTWKLGRMDLTYGDGFLVWDGTPADGSSSGFFDGARLRCQRGLLQADLFMTKVMDRGFGGAGLDEDFHGLYLKRSEIEVYTLHRYKHQATTMQGGKPWQVIEPRQRTIAIGNRLSSLPETGWQGAFEWTFEFGKYEDPASGGPIIGDVAPTGTGRSAFGVTGRGGRTWATVARPAFELGGVYLTGDDPMTDEYEGFDDFYAEWPRYSELLIYTLYDATTRVQRIGGKAPSYSDETGAWTNLEAGWIEGRITPFAGLRVTARGTLLRAVEAIGPGEGKDRGTLAAARLDYTGIPNVALQALGEWFDPGDYYAEKADPAWYARFQVSTGF